MDRAEDDRIDFCIFTDVGSCEARYPAGAQIFASGAIGDVIYVIKKGIVAIQIQGNTVERIYDGDVFVEKELLSKPHSATVLAVTDVILNVVDEQRFLMLVRKTPVFALLITRILTSRIRALNRRLTDADRAMV
jgi:CRP/FNR family transcriptional regulator, cyclic AMP receptor protein